MSIESQDSMYTLGSHRVHYLILYYVYERIVMPVFKFAASQAKNIYL